MTPARCSVLIVEDEPLTRLNLATALVEEGFDVVEAGDAASGIALFRSRRSIEAVVADIGLPGGLSGYELVKAVRQERPGCTVIMATGSPLRMPTDFDEHVLVEPKPYDSAKIALILRMRHSDNI